MRHTGGMKPRPHWIERIESAWRQRSVVWLPGVRRVGKTTLCLSLPDIEYFDCELPRVRRQMEDPEAFLADLHGKRIVLDEIHRLERPAEVLKIAADHHRSVQIVATGSSTLGASAKFRDTLAGRKVVVWLTPMNRADLVSFGDQRLTHRMLHGGLPSFFLAEAPPAREFEEWLDAFWARDIQELFRLEKRQSFQKFVELLLVASGGIFEATRFARACEASRTTLTNYLGVLEATFVAHIVRPFNTRKSTEIVAAPKVYGFDSGFVAHHRGWSEVRPEDAGDLWEHFVLNELHAERQSRDILYWRDKQGHEIDFVLVSGRRAPRAIECKWKAAEFDPANLLVFRAKYPRGENFVVAADVDRPYRKVHRGLSVRYVSLSCLIEDLASPE